MILLLSLLQHSISFRRQGSSSLLHLQKVPSHFFQCPASSALFTHFSISRRARSWLDPGIWYCLVLDSAQALWLGAMVSWLVFPFWSRQLLRHSPFCHEGSRACRSVDSPLWLLEAFW